ncbi:MAG: hypothetical protein ACOX7J_05565 [Bacillota bacterium]|jgi:hypothetical protein
MSKFICPMSEVAIEHIKTLTESYKLAVDAVCEYNSIALADKKQLAATMHLADQLRRVIESYICSWENGSPCLTYSCGWEYCQRNLQILNALPNLPDLPSQDYSTDINITTNEAPESE